MISKISLFLMMTCLLSAGVLSQSSKESNLKDYSKDHKSIDSIIAATYEVISGEKGEARDWDRFRALFHKDAKLIPTGNNQAAMMSPDDYIKNAEPFLVGQGFHEIEIASRREIFGSIAHVFSTYEAKKSKTDKEPFMRGINSFQLFNDGKRWWVLNIFWQQESAANPIPSKYLKSN